MASFRRHEKHILSSLHPYVSGLLPAVCLLSLLLPAVMSLLTLKGFKSTPALDTLAPGQLRCPVVEPHSANREKTR
jgi:hypothetical protein